MDKISTPGFLLMKSHGQKEPSPWGRKRVRRNLATKQQQYTVGLHDILLPRRNDSSLQCFISTSARPWRLVGNKSFRWKEAWVVHWVVPLLRLLITVAKVQLDDWRGLKRWSCFHFSYQKKHQKVLSEAGFHSVSPVMFTHLSNSLCKVLRNLHFQSRLDLSKSCRCTVNQGKTP